MFQQYVVPHDPDSSSRIQALAFAAPSVLWQSQSLVAAPFLSTDNVLLTSAITGGSATVFSGLMLPVRMNPLSSNTEVAFSYSFNISHVPASGVPSEIIPMLIGFEQSSTSVTSVTPASFRFCYPLPCDLTLTSTVAVCSAQGVYSVPSNPVTSTNSYFVAVVFMSKWLAGQLSGAVSLREVTEERAVFQPLK